MKTTRRLLTVVATLVLMQQQLSGQPIACPYPFTNSLPLLCDVSISYEMLDGSCACPSGCGPVYLNCGNGGSIPGGSTTVNLNGSSGICCNVNTITDIVIFLDEVDCDATCCSGILSNGCHPSGTTSFSGTTPSTADCGGVAFTITWTSSGATIQ